MGLMTALAGRGAERNIREVDREDIFYQESLWSTTSLTGIRVNPQTALACTAVMACVTMISEDVAKCTPQIYARRDDGGRAPAKDHFLYELFASPNDWQDGFEFFELGTAGLVFRGNAYVVLLRDTRGRVIEFVPVNPDWVALWEAPTGELFYRVTPQGLHMLAKLRGQPSLIPARDVLHVKGFSLGGLLGASRIALANDAVGLAIGQQQQAARWMANGTRSSGVLQTDKTLNDGAAKRMRAEWQSSFSGLQNTGNVPVLEQGLKYQALGMSASDLEFIASRTFQVAEIARIFRIPPHMIGDLSRSTFSNIETQGLDYINYTIAGFTNRWARKMEWHFGLRKLGMFIDFDTSQLTRADVTARYNAYRVAILSGIMTQNEARIDDGKNPIAGGDRLLSPSNMAGAGGSAASGQKADGGGRPEDGTVN
jgi:HK97 family phage portal protein